MDLMQDLRRTCYCSEVTKAGETVVVGGFVQKVRNLGNLIFIDLRDRTGIVQLAFNDQTDRAIFEKAASCHSEYVLLAKGVVAERSSINKDMKTGAAVFGAPHRKGTDEGKQQREHYRFKELAAS